MATNKQTIKAYTLKNAIEHDGKAVVSSVISGLFNHGLKKENIKKIMPEINLILEEINSFTIDEQKVLFENVKGLIGHRKTRQGLPELKNVKKPIIMRFSPSASGPLHIGHALTASTSFLYTQKYKGKFYVRIEDTNPENSFKDSYKMIKRDSDWLFNKKAEIIIQSKRIPMYYKYIEKLLRKQAVYVCTCSQEQFKKYSEQKNNCPCRNLSQEEQSRKWKKMLDKNNKTNYKQGQAILRFKSGMKNKNPAMRDFPLARINTTPHPLQKNKFRVWPLMNLAVSVDDIEMKMTHIIRAKDHKDNAERQKMIFKILNKKYPQSYFLGKIHLKDMELSTSKMRADIKAGKYTGWDDLKLPTLISLRKQGYKPEAFHKFAEQIGLNEIDKTIDKKEFFLLLNNFNK